MKVHFREGDSFNYYSQLYWIPLNLLIDSNRHIDVQNVKRGEIIHIPGFEIEKYTIRENDELNKLAAKRNLSNDAIILVNQGCDFNNISIGSTIFLPKRVCQPVINGKRKYNYDALSQDIEKILELYPFIKVKEIGKSVLGNSIKEIRIGRGEKKVHMNASFHANEWITTSVIMSLLNSFLLSITNLQAMKRIHMAPFYDLVQISIVPMVNPDGVNLVINGSPEENWEDLIQMNGGSQDFSGWKANIRGVDLNNQFPANWEIEKERKIPKSPAFRDYPGEMALSEPEAIAMAKLANENHFSRVIAFHTQGEEFYWGYEGNEPPESMSLAAEFERMSGYKSVQNVDSHAGFKDWFIQTFKRSGFTIELGKGINPLPLSQFNEIYKKVEGLFLASLYM